MQEVWDARRPIVKGPKYSFGAAFAGFKSARFPMQNNFRGGLNAHCSDGIRRGRRLFRRAPRLERIGRDLHCQGTSSRGDARAWPARGERARRHACQGRQGHGRSGDYRCGGSGDGRRQALGYRNGGAADPAADRARRGGGFVPERRAEGRCPARRPRQRGAHGRGRLYRDLDQGAGRHRPYRPDAAADLRRVRRQPVCARRSLPCRLARPPASMRS